MIYSIRHAHRDGLHTAIRTGEPFKTHGSLWGRSGGAPDYGYLPPEWITVMTRQRVDYVVYSYSTPIAWHVVGEGWYMPDVRYSVTTGRHQSVVRAALCDATITSKIGLFT